MGTITTGVGLISGLNIQDIVTKLMAIEQRPLLQLQARVQTLDAEKAAILDLCARVLGIKSALAPLKTVSFFQTTKASSSNPDVIQATAAAGASPGAQRLRVAQLATAQQLVSRGVADADRTPIGAGTLIVTSALARLTRPTELGFLNAQQGVSRGTIRITDGAGASATVDLSGAGTVEDVIRAINGASGIAVRAEVRGDRLAVVDLSGQSVSALTVADVGDGRTAQDLGIAGASTSGEIIGTDVNTIGEATLLSLLNDGNGVGTAGVREDMRITAADGTSFIVNLGDLVTVDTNLAVLNGGLGVRLGTIRITDSAGVQTEVDLTGAQSTGEVMTRIQAAARVTVITTGSTGNQFRVTDAAGGKGKLIIEDVTGHAAADLGIAGESAGADTTDPESILGDEIYHIRTIGDVLRAINYAAGNNGAVTATLDAAGKRITLQDQTSGAGALTIEALNGSAAAADLGLAGPSAGGTLTGKRLIATLNTTMLRSLNGGRGISELGQIRVRDRAGNESIFDLSGARTVDDVLAVIQSQTGGAQVQARLSDSGLGLVIDDLSGGTGTLSIEDVVGTTAADLHIAGQTTGDELRGGSLYRQFVGAGTALRDLNGGRGIAGGQIRITDSAGGSSLIALTKASEMTLGEAIEQINSQVGTAHFQARINDTGDGIVVIDTAGGTLQLKIEDVNSTTAHDLRLAGQAAAGQDRIDGRASVEITVDATDGLNDLAGRLAAAGHLLEATVINDRSGIAPYRLLITAANTGTRGALTIDTSGLDLGLSTLVKPQDALVYFGGDAGYAGVPVTLSTNQLRDMMPGVTIDLLGESDKPVTVSVARDPEGVVKALSDFANRFNEVIRRAAELTKYDDQTKQRGVLLGDSTVDQLRSRLYDMLSTRAAVDGPYRRLSDVGLKLGRGAELEFDEQALRDALETSPDAVRRMFTDDKQGLFAKLDKILTALTDRTQGLLSTRQQALTDRQDLFNKRIADMNTLLAGKEKRLYAQFQAMEAALAQLQGQQAALTSLSSMVQYLSSSANG